MHSNNLFVSVEPGYSSRWGKWDEVRDVEWKSGRLHGPSWNLFRRSTEEASGRNVEENSECEVEMIAVNKVGINPERATGENQQTIKLRMVDKPK